MAATLTSKHYIRSTNQWSDPATQVWLYGHDAEDYARRVQASFLRAGPDDHRRFLALHDESGDDIDEMIAYGLLGEADRLDTGTECEKGTLTAEKGCV